MRINYKMFMKHAEKMVKGSKINRPVLEGIHHDDQGTVTVTDSFRLYKAYDLKAPTNTVIHAITGDDITESVGNYPNTDRLVPDKDDAKLVAYTDKPKQLLATLKAMKSIATSFGYKKNQADVKLVNEVIEFHAKDKPVDVSFKLEGVPTDEDITSLFDLDFMIEAMDFIDDTKANKVYIHVFDGTKPILISTHTENKKGLDILVMRKIIK